MCTVDIPVCCLPQPCLSVCVAQPRPRSNSNTDSRWDTDCSSLSTHDGLRIEDRDKVSDVTWSLRFYRTCADIGWGLNTTDTLKCPENSKIKKIHGQKLPHTSIEP